MNLWPPLGLRIVEGVGGIRAVALPSANPIPKTARLKRIAVLVADIALLS